jgi:uncharacterized protein YndB with AHSA1/START domain
MLDPIQLSREIEAPPGEVWRALTTPALIEKWLMPNDFKPVVGKPFTFTWDSQGKDRDGKAVCKVTQLIPKRQLTYTWREKGFPTYTMVTFELEPNSSGTLLTLTHDRWERFDKANWQHYWQALRDGWRDTVLTALAATVEEQVAVEV